MDVALAFVTGPKDANVWMGAQLDAFDDVRISSRDYLEKNLVSLGLTPRISLEILPRIVMGLLDGLVMQAFVDPDAMSPDEVVDAVQTIALSIFTGGPGA